MRGGGVASRSTGAVHAVEGFVIAPAILQSKWNSDCVNLAIPAPRPAAWTSAHEGATGHAQTQAIPAAADRSRPARRELPTGARSASPGTGRGLRRADLGPDPRWRRGAPGRHRRAHGRGPAD